MKSSFINFVEKYKSVKMNHTKLKELWKKEIDKSDFDKNEQEVFEWFQEYRKKVIEMIKSGNLILYKKPKKRTEWIGGWKMSDESKQKIRDSKTGSKNPSWKGGITPERKKAYFSSDYKLWRKSVFERDNYTCKICGSVGGELNADHIKPWALYQELRYDINNGRTLCKECHKKTDTYGNKSIYRVK